MFLRQGGFKLVNRSSHWREFCFALSKVLFRMPLLSDMAGYRPMHQWTILVARFPPNMPPKGGIILMKYATSQPNCYLRNVIPDQYKWNHNLTCYWWDLILNYHPLIFRRELVWYVWHFVFLIPTNRQSTLVSCYFPHKGIKKWSYLKKKVRSNIPLSHPLTDGSTSIYMRLASISSTHWNLPYSSWCRCHFLSFSLLQSSTMCVRGGSGVHTPSWPATPSTWTWSLVWLRAHYFIKL